MTTPEGSNIAERAQQLIRVYEAHRMAMIDAAQARLDNLSGDHPEARAHLNNARLEANSVFPDPIQMFTALAIAEQIIHAEEIKQAWAFVQDLVRTL